jgi:hypothetical protein
MVIGDMDGFCKAEVTQCRQVSEIDEAAFKQVLYVYLASVVAMALTSMAEKNRAFKDVISHFRMKVLQEATERWNTTEDALDREVEQTSDNLAQLIFTDPKEQPGLDFDWSRKWLQLFGAVESNPITLFKIAFKWKNSFLHLRKMLDGFKIG